MRRSLILIASAVALFAATAVYGAANLSYAENWGGVVVRTGCDSDVSGSTPPSVVGGS